MAGGIDTSARKPRRLRGTPAVKFSNRFAFAVLGFGVISGLILKYHTIFIPSIPAIHNPLFSFNYCSCIPLVDDINKKFNINILEVSKEEKERRTLINFVQQRRGTDILELLEQKKALEKDL